MSRMFCTLKEAAETLNTSEDQINTLLERGLLPEFRQGPHRLLREADVDALDLRRGHHTGPQPSAQPPVQTERPSPRSGAKPKARRTAQRKVHPRAAAGPRLARDKRQKPEDARQKMENRPARPPLVDRPSSVPPTMTVRQWFWMGLVQDRPIAIALLSGLVLLALSALVAGICLVAEGL